jgi:hypothetical protein
MKKLLEGLSGFIVIVVGVLVALAADAAWAERSDRIREQEALADLLEEFRANETMLLGDIATNREAKAGGQGWADAMLGRLPIPVDSANALLRAALWDARFDPATGALRSLIDGGELRLIQNSDLRRALAGWEDRTAEARLTTQSWDSQRHTLLPFVLGLPNDRPLTSTERSAVFLFAESVAGQSGQLEALLDPIRDLAAMIESEMARK